jgi:glucose/arabinose dehydrogenase
MRAWKWGCLLVGLVVGLLAAPATAPALTLQSIGPAFDEPVFVTSPPGDPRLFVVERPGRIQVVHDGTVSQFLDIHTMTTTTSERGLLSMAFDPNYATNGAFYVFYTGDGPNSGGALGDIHIDEYHVSADPNVADPATRRTVWTFPHSAGNHDGGQLQFGPDGLLYITVGDNANGANAQSLATPYGKVFRIDPHGVGPGAHSVPPTNPFVGTPGAIQETWSLGLRNPFRFSFDRLNGDLIIADVGEVSFEEIDLATAASGGGRGANFGWPSCEAFTGNCAGFTPPVFAYPHTDPGGDVAHGCAILGGYVYRGSLAPEIAGRYLYADLCVGELRSIQLDVPSASGDRPESAPGALGSPRSFGEDSACNVYVTNTTTVFRIVGSGGAGASTCASSPAACCPAGQVSCCPKTGTTGKKHKKCRKHKKKKRAAEAKKHKKHKKCKKHKKRKKKRI